MEHRSYPNQGTWLSARNAAKAGLLLGVACGLVYGIVYGVALSTGALAGPVEALRTGALVGPVEALRIGVLRGLTMALRIGVLFALWYGLFDVFKHLTLRGLLATSSGPRWNLVQFLEHAAQLGFLQKVGGGYIFPNRLLQEHFAGWKATVMNTQLDFSAFIADRTKDFTGREWVFRKSTHGWRMPELTRLPAGWGPGTGKSPWPPAWHR